MGPSAVSTVVEQIARIIFLLAGAYIVIHVMDGSVVTAISVATFAAFIGAVFGLIVLYWYFFKRKKHLDQLLEKDKGQADVSLFGMYSEIVLYAIPFIFVGIAIPLYQLIDQITFSRAMSQIGLADQAVSAFGILNFSTQKLVIIPVSLATAFAMTLVPMVTSSFVKGDQGVVKRQLDQTFEVLLFLTVPAAVGMALLAEPLYTIFYTHSELGTDVLRIYAPVAILFALFSVTAAILQGINEQRFTVLSLLTGILVKLSLNIPLIKLFETEGAVYATALGYLTSIIINLIVIRVYASYSLRPLAKKIGLITAFNAAMAIVVIALYGILSLVLSTESDGSALLIVTICASAGMLVYFALSQKSGLLDGVFGSRLDGIKRKLRLKKA